MNESKNRDNFNKLNGNQKINSHRNYTHWELLEKIDKYERFTKTKEDRDKLLKAKADYIKRNEKKVLNRARRDEVFAMGWNRGISRDKTHLDLYEGDKLQDERDRQKLAKSMKGHYHKNFSLSRGFKRTINKNKGMLKE